MKTKFFGLLLALLQVSLTWAQTDEPFYTIMENDFGIRGGKSGKTYQVIIKNKNDKKTQIEKTLIMFNNMGIIDKSGINLNNVCDTTSTFTAPFFVQTGIGIHPVSSEPLHLHGDLLIEFYEEGMKLSIKNFTEEFFLIVKRPKIGENGSKNWQKYQEFDNMARLAANATSKFGKVIAKIDKIQEISHITNRNSSLADDAKQKISSKINEANADRLKLLDEYRSRVSEQEALFTDMVNNKEGKWYSLEEYIENAKSNSTFMKYKSAANHFLEGYQTALAGERLYALDDERWNRDIRYLFDGIFITLAEELDGSIESVIEDNILTWKRQGDLVVPTDPKKMKKYIKKGKSFTDYDSYDN